MVYNKKQQYDYFQGGNGQRFKRNRFGLKEHAKVHQQSLHTWSPEKCFSDDSAESTKAVWMVRHWPQLAACGPELGLFIDKETDLQNPLKPLEP